MNRIIVTLFRIKFGLKKYQKFQFTNQRNRKDLYYFSDKELIKIENGYLYQQSGVSLNWLMNKDCRIDKLPIKEV